jgi:hypothetical protein
MVPSKSWWRCVGHVSLSFAYNLQIPPVNGKEARAAEEIYQKLLPNRKLGHIYKVHAAHIIKTTSFGIYRNKYFNNSITLDEHLKNKYIQTRRLFRL